MARLDPENRLRIWNERFAEVIGIPLDDTMMGTPIEDLLRQQAGAGLFGEAADPEQEVATRLTILHAAGQSIAPPTQIGPAGEQIAMHVRGMFDGGHVIVLTGPENARLATLPPLPPDAEAEPETADETTEW